MCSCHSKKKYHVIFFKALITLIKWRSRNDSSTAHKTASTVLWTCSVREFAWRNNDSGWIIVPKSFLSISLIGVRTSSSSFLGKFHAVFSSPSREGLAAGAKWQDGKTVALCGLGYLQRLQRTIVLPVTSPQDCRKMRSHKFLRVFFPH